MIDKAWLSKAFQNLLSRYRGEGGDRAPAQVSEGGAPLILDMGKARRMFSEHRAIGGHTVVVTETGNRFWGFADHSYRMLQAIKRNLPETRFLFLINPDFTGNFAAFKGVWEEATVVYSMEQDPKALRQMLASLGPALVFIHGRVSSHALFERERFGFASRILRSAYCPVFEPTPHPYDRYLWLDKNHIFLMRILPGVEAASSMEVPERELSLVRECLIPMLIDRSFSPLENRHPEAYGLHLEQFKGFREKYTRIIVISYSNHKKSIADPLNHLRTFVRGLPDDWLIIFTIHPSYKQSRELLDQMNRNTEFDVNLHLEVKNQPGTYRPMELLKSEFPNLVTEYDLEIKRVHGTPEMPSLTDFIIRFCDAVVCNYNSKTSFRAMEAGKPVFTYWREPSDFCHRLLGLQMDDLAAYDFSKPLPSNLYEKVFHFLFTRVLHRPMLWADVDFPRFLEYIEHERVKIERGLTVTDIRFYDRENQTIEEVLEIVAASEGMGAVQS